jgi:hypothetical protein
MGRRLEGGICRLDIAYSPLPSQKAFHESGARFKGFSGPVGSGKSAALCQEALRMAFVNAGRTGLLGAPTYPMLRDTTQASFLEVLEENEIPYELNRSENILTLRDVGSRILFRSLEEYERLRGTNLSWYAVDELTYTHEEAWLRLESRLRDPKARRLCGFAVWTPKGYDWVYRKFVNPGTAGYETIQARPMENKHVLRAAPDFYERLKASYDESFYRQEVLGEYLEKDRDRVYENFEQGRHLRRMEFEPGLPLLWSLDFNVDPLCTVVAQRGRDGIRVIDEIVLKRATTKDACQELLNRYARRLQTVIIYGDASGWHMHTSGTNDYAVIKETFQRAGFRAVDIRVPRSNPAVADRVALVNAKLRNAYGDTELWIDPKCRSLVQDLAEVMYKPRSTIVDKERDANRTHASDALGYLLWQEYGEKQTVGEQNRRLL